MYHICVDSKKVMTAHLNFEYSSFDSSATLSKLHICNTNSFPIPCLNIIVALEELGRIYCIWIYLQLATFTQTHPLKEIVSC